MKVSVHQPSHNKRPGVAVIEPLGFQGNFDNSRARIDMVADRTQTTHVSVQRHGTGTTTIDLGMKQALRPTQYGRTVADSVDELRGEIYSVAGWFDSLAGHGASGGGALVAALAKLGVFERVLIRNGVNVRARYGAENPIIGTANFVGYLAFGERHKTADPAAPEIPHIPETISGREKLLRGIAEIRLYRRLLLSAYTVAAVGDLAADPLLPMRYIDVGHTFSGRLGQSASYALSLEEMRATAAGDLRRSQPGAQPAGFAATVVEEMWHSDLVSRPDIAAIHIEEMFALPAATVPTQAA